jgi:plastocyanin domain-containing protein
MKRIVARLLLFAFCVTLLASVAIEKPSRKTKLQTATRRITERGYEPLNFKLRRGVPGRVTFLRTTDQTCAKEIALPDFNIRRDLPLNQRVVMTFTPKQKGTFTFVCGMNIMRGRLMVQ